MIVPALLAAAAFIGTLAALSTPPLSDLILLTAPCLAASLILLAHAIWRFLRRPRPQFIVIDGSNVMHWRDGTPRIETLRDVVQHLIAMGYTPGVIFDANVGHRLSGHYQHDAAMGRHLGLPSDRVIVVNKGTPADPTILAAARDLGARIVTNDRYNDWAVLHPEVKDAGHLVKGGYQSGKLWLDLGDAQAHQKPQQRHPNVRT